MPRNDTAAGSGLSHSSAGSLTFGIGLRPSFERQSLTEHDDEVQKILRPLGAAVTATLAFGA
jgi:hypothetical protein